MCKGDTNISIRYMHNSTWIILDIILSQCILLKCRFRIGHVVMEDSVVASVLIKNTLSVTMVVHVDTGVLV